MQIKTKLNFLTIQKILFLLYFIAISAYQLGKGFDAIFVRTIFVILFLSVIIFNKKIIINSQVVWILMFWGFYFLSSIWAEDKNDTFYYINNSIQIIILTIIIPLSVKKEKDIDDILKMLVFSLVYAGILAIIRSVLTNFEEKNIGKLIGLHQNGLGLRMAIGTIITLYLMYKDDKKKNKLFYIFCLIFFVIIVLFTGSKKSLFMIMLGLALFEIMRTKKMQNKVIKVFMLIFCAIILIYFIMSNPTLYARLGRRLERTFLTLQGSASGFDVDNSLNERMFYIEQALEIFEENPILGYGGNNFVTHMRNIKYSHIAYSHNNFTELLCTLGIVGFSIYYYFWIKIIITLFKKVCKNKKYIDLLFLDIIIILLILDYGNVSYISILNFIILALANANINLERKKKDKNENNSIYKKS